MSAIQSLSLPLSLANGGTGATDAAAARTALADGSASTGTGGLVRATSPTLTSLTASGTVQSSAYAANADLRIASAATALTLDATTTPAYDGKILDFTAATAVTVTLDADTPTGWQCGGSQKGAGVVEFVAGAGVVIDSLSDLKNTAGQHATFALYKTEAGRYLLSGGLA